MNPTSQDACVPPRYHGPRRRLADVVATPILLFATFASLMLTTAPLLVLFWLMQPATRANPGVSAYNPPPATRVEPIGHRLDTSDPAAESYFAADVARD